MDTTTKVTGAALFGRALAKQVKTAFYLMGGPMFDAENACIAEGIRMVDVRHEQAAAMMAHAYARVLGKPGACMAASGPGTINLTTGLANALVDCVPVVAFGGSSPVDQYGMGAFQEIDQVAIMRPVTKWAERVYEARRIPQYVELAFAKACAGKPGPVYLDLPGDVLHQEVDEKAVRWPQPLDERVAPRSGATREALERVVKLLEGAERPLILTGSGILWSGASEALRRFVEATGIPFYTTPQGRGVIPEDHRYFYANARSTAYKEADLLLVVGTRLNYVFAFGRPPRFSASARFVRIDTDADEINSSDNPSTRRGFPPIRCPSIPCGCARRCATSSARTRSSWSTGRKSSPTRARPSRATCPATASTRAPSAPWVWGCRSRSAPRPQCPASRWWCCTATARSD
jgi:thiamine pyrophosphate-dependent acetolactate synthase large subunit-like protein